MREYYVKNDKDFKTLFNIIYTIYNYNIFSMFY